MKKLICTLIAFVGVLTGGALVLTSVPWFVGYLIRKVVHLFVVMDPVVESAVLPPNWPLGLMFMIAVFVAFMVGALGWQLASDICGGVNESKTKKKDTRAN